MCSCSSPCSENTFCYWFVPLSLFLTQTFRNASVDDVSVFVTLASCSLSLSFSSPYACSIPVKLLENLFSVCLPFFPSRYLVSINKCVLRKCVSMIAISYERINVFATLSLRKCPCGLSFECFCYADDLLSAVASVSASVCLSRFFAQYPRLLLSLPRTTVDMERWTKNKYVSSENSIWCSHTMSTLICVCVVV